MVQNLEDLIVALFECVSTTSDESARQGIGESLHLLGTKQPSLFLSAAHAFLLQQNKLSGKNRAFVLSSISRVLEKPAVTDEVEEQQELLIVNLATQEMAMTKDSDEEWANSAKDLLVTLAKIPELTSSVMDALLQKFPPGLTVPPHRYVVLAFAAVAEHNASGFLPFLTDILSRTMPLLVHIRTDSLRCSWSQAIVAFVKAIFEVAGASSTEESIEAVESDEHDIASNYTDQMEAIYDSIMPWIASKDSKVRADAAECIGRLCLLINGQRLNQDLKKLVTIFLTLYRKAFHDEYYTITKAVCAFIEALCLEESRPFEYYFDDLLNALFPHVCTLAEQSMSNEEPNVSSETMKMQAEIFQCFSTVSSRFADRIVYFLLHKMQNSQDSVKLGAISVMRHLLNFSKNLCECERIILMGLKPLLKDEANQFSFVVRKSLCQLCVAFCDNLHLSTDIGGANVISFILANMVPPVDVTRRVLTDLEQTTLAQLNLQCSQALHAIASGCKMESNLLFPYLLEFIYEESADGSRANYARSAEPPVFPSTSRDRFGLQDGVEPPLPLLAGVHLYGILQSCGYLHHEEPECIH
uniref:HEAT repeat-containing protein n=1 Tax=Steinernema glaseri TaxID=37863 RepID=A0A1I7Z9H7_9BILA